MVKNHALKAAARARKAETGETLHEAMRKSDTTSRSALTVHLGLGTYFDFDGETPHLFISGGPKSGKTTMVKHVLNELKGRGVHLTVFASAPSEYVQEFPGVAMVDAGGRPSAAELMLDALATAARGGHKETNHKLIVIDALEALSEDAMISLQILARAGKAAGVTLVIVSQRAPEGILRSNTHHIMAGPKGLYSLDKQEIFQLGAPMPSGKSTVLKVGDKASWDLETGHMMIVGRPGIGKTELAKQIAMEALTSGKKVTVMASSGNDESWRKSCGEVIPVHSGASPEGIDKLTAQNWGKDSNQSILIIDGLHTTDKRHSDLTLQEKIVEAALINALRSGNFRVILVDSQASDLAYFFGNTVALADMLPKNEQAINGLSVNQIIGASPRNRAEDDVYFKHCGVGTGLLLAPSGNVYEEFEF